MPVYDYKCEEHGVFHELAAMDTWHKPCACPKCGEASPRIIMIPPEVLAMAPGRKKAMAHNEEARHSPIISSVDSRQEAKARLAHDHKQGKCGCSHEHAGHQSPLKQQLIYLPDGSKVFPSQRPWMISH